MWKLVLQKSEWQTAANFHETSSSSIVFPKQLFSDTLTSDLTVSKITFQFGEGHRLSVPAFRSRCPKRKLSNTSKHTHSQPDLQSEREGKMEVQVLLRQVGLDCLILII